MIKTVEVPVISATTPGSMAPASSAAEAPSTEPKKTGVPTGIPDCALASGVTSPCN